MTEEWEQYAIVANAASTFSLVGLIWFVQLVHYPLFAQVGTACFADYHAAHTRWTTAVVFLPMVTELTTAAALAWRPPTERLAFWCQLGLFLVVVIWISTAWLQVPRHRVLSQSFNASIHRELVLTNWLRTAAWTARGLICLFILAQCHFGVTPRGS